MARLRQRQQEQIIQKVLRRVSPAAGGSAPGPVVTGVSSYNGRTGAVVSTLTDIPAHAPTHKSGGSDAIKLDELAAPTDILTLNSSTSQHGLLPKLPGGTSTFLRADGTFAAPVASLSLTTAELNVAASPQTRRSGHVQITGLAGLTVGKPVLVQQAAGPYTGKGTRTDEAEMDMLVVTGKVLNATTIDLYWQSKYQVHGNFKFDYAVAA